ncbi:NAD(P)H-dependent oxidoreductase [Streptomyces sp. NPDC001982]|uniref:NAD(P)H-dependent oxidoreductase n=1 Tax=Streptomyces sp. NPDC001982 TaxID=3154405 RepID=UPI00332DDCCE
MSSPSTLVVLGHPYPHESRVNKALAAAICDLPHVTAHDIYQAYPDRQINVAAEQHLVCDHAVLVLQFPLYWYSMPGFLKQWLDDVMLPGFAYDNGRGRGLVARLEEADHAVAAGAAGQAGCRGAVVGIELVDAAQLTSLAVGSRAVIAGLAGACAIRTRRVLA